MNLNFKQQSVGETTYLVYDMDDNLEIDSFAMHMMSHNQILNIVQTQIVRMNEKRQIQFNITGLAKLNGRILAPRPKKEILGILGSILNAFEEADAYMLNMEHLLLDWEYIYLDGNGNCLLMYLPFAHAFNMDKIAFLQEIVSRIPPDYREKDPYLFDILNAFSRGAIQKLSDFREIIKKSAGISKEEHRGEKEITRLEQNQEIPMAMPQKKEEKIIPEAAEKKEEKKSEKKSEKKPAANPKIPLINIPAREPKEKGEKEKERKKKGAKEKEPPRIPQQAPKKKVGSFLIPKKQKEEKAMVPKEEGIKSHSISEAAPAYTRTEQKDMYESYENTVYIQEPAVMHNKSEGTIMLDQPEFPMRASARLTRKSDGTVYRIDKDKAMIGSGAAADICIYNNSAISRKHAMILYENGDYYIEDNQSKNGSFISGRRLYPRMREPLYDRTLLRFANEDFEFSKDE